MIEIIALEVVGGLSLEGDMESRGRGGLICGLHLQCEHCLLFLDRTLEAYYYFDWTVNYMQQDTN